jgi:anti-anti-sigma factor
MEAMEIQHSIQQGCLVMALTGRIDPSSVSQIQATLLKNLSDQPAALICDLAGVQYLDPVCAMVFSTVANHSASRRPATTLLLCGARPQVAAVLRRVKASQLVPLYATVEEALEAAGARPPQLREELRLAPIPTAPAVARAFVRQVCQRWQLARPDETLLDRAVLVANELVTNAVVHARTELWLQLELRADRLVIEVRDDSPRRLRATIPDLEAEGGRGLWLVEQLARVWGVRRHPDGGKVVWCTLAL